AVHGETLVNMYLPAFLRSPAQRGMLALAAAAFLALFAPAAQATKIERVMSPGGIEIWLVRDATVPLIALDFAFQGGSAQDPEGKYGVCNMALDLLDDGAGELDAKGFHELLERKAIEMNFNTGRE